MNDDERLDRLESTEAIRRLVAQYALAPDSCRGEVQVDDRWVIQAIHYRDTYERRDDAWYFVRRRHLLWYGAEVGQSPLGLPPANWPEHHTGKGELPEAWDTWRDFWGP